MNKLTGQTFKQMIISAANHLYNNYPKIDALNVFPVPDGDTGTNMNLTFSSGVKEINNLSTDSLYEIAKAFAKGLLMGARGNSGVILSQIFKGFSVAVGNNTEIDLNGLKDAFISGKEVAYKAVLKPVEGTILTVIREASAALKTDKKTKTIEDAIEFILIEARASLQRTPNLLPILKEVGVVDSGGAGLVTILEGFSSALKGKVIERMQATSTETFEQSVQSKIENEEFGYCTEFILRVGGKEKKIFNKTRFTTVLDQSGNSLVVVQDEDLVKIHVHTLYPGKVLDFAQRYGEFVKLKIENMQEQHSHIIEEDQTNVESMKFKEFGLIAVSVGDGLNKLFASVNVDKIVTGGQTMNPSTEDFLAAIKGINANTIYILPNNSNIILAANQAAELTTEKTVIVIPTVTIPQGLIAAMQFNPEVDVQTNTQTMTEAFSNVKSGQVTFSIRDTKINDIDIKANQYIGITGKKIVASCEDIETASLKLLEEMIDEDSFILTIYYGEDTNEKQSYLLSEKIKKKFPNIDIEIYQGNQPVYPYIFGVE